MGRRRKAGVALLRLVLVGLSWVGIATANGRNVEHTTIPASAEDTDAHDPEESVEVSFSNATVLHIEDAALEVVTANLFKHHPQLEHCHISGTVHSIDRDAFASAKRFRTLRLDGNQLTAVPKEALRAGLPLLESLSISSNRLPALLADDFLRTGDLQRLSVSENFIASVQQGAFDALPRLTFLNLSWNELASFDGLQPLARLTVLDLGYNYAKLLNVSHLRPLRDLRELSVRGNLLAGLPSGAFASLAELRRLDLGDNFLQSLPKRLFAANARLEELTLDGNRLERLPEELLRGLTRLQILDVRNNRLATLAGGTVFRDQPPLVRLALEGNRLERLEPAVLRSTDVLLQNNRIRVLRRATPANATDVRNLFLYGNEIATIEQDALEDLPALELLYADYNHIAELPAMLFHASQHLQHAGFSRNALAVLRTNTFAGLARLHSVDLSHNRLGVIEPGAFHGSPVEYLNLNGNRLRALDDGAFAGTRLGYLHLAGNDLPSLHQRWGEVWRDLLELSANDNRIASLQPLCSGLFPRLAVVDLRNNSLATACRQPLPPHGPEAVAYDLALNGYAEVPPLPGRVRSLDLSGNPLAGFGANQFRGYEHTETVLLRDTSLAKLAASDLAYLVRLNRLEVGSKALQSIDEDTFHSRALQHLALNDSPLRRLPDRLLAGQTNLSLVSFARNRISYLPSGFFRDCHRLEEVNLAFNELEAVDPAWFRQLEHLRALSLEANRIAQLPADLLTVEQSLDALSVAANRLTSIDDASFLADVPIRALNVSHNRLADIGALQRNDFVAQLDVSGNRLERLVVRPHLRTLAANSNRIASLAWQGAGPGTKWELQRLELADNRLTEVDPRLFEARQLRAIDVSENRLNRFPFELVHRLKLLQTLVVSRNNIRSVPGDVPFGFKLGTLDLSENPLETQGGFLNSSLIEHLIVTVV